MAEGPVFALPPGADFARAFAAGLTARFAGAPPEELARAEVYLATGRMRRAVAAALAADGARLLPRLRLVTDPGAALPLAGLPPPAPRLRRLLDLARLTRAALDRSPDLGPPAAAFALAESLARLIDEMAEEGVAPASLALLDVGGHARHWQRAQAFLAIVAGYLAGSAGAPDPGARQAMAVAALEAGWAVAPPAHAVIVAGSTGSRGTTAALMAAVARLPAGAVVLPGFDDAMPAAAWAALATDDGAEDHPQTRFLRFLDRLGMAPADVAPWIAATPPDPARNRLVSLALRPAPVTDAWRAEGPGLGNLVGAVAGLTLIEAPSPRAEAAALALLMREAVGGGRRVALVTPDRGLTRQVAAALGRWGIRPDDSAGQPLALTPPGRLLRQTAALFGRQAEAAALLAVLKHPLAHGGAGRGPHLLHTRELELWLRRGGPAYPDASDLARWAALAEGRAGWAAWLSGLLSCLADAAPAPLAERFARHLRLAEGLAAGTGAGGAGLLWDGAAGEEARSAIDALGREAATGPEVTPADYLALLETLFSGRALRETVAADPRAMIWGTIEARVGGADLVLLGGLNEGSWPAAPSPDPWLSRPMRRAAALLLPERQIGLAAHDFQQAVAAPQAVLSRAIRDSDAQTVPARWLNRLMTLLAGLPGGADALAAMRGRGDRALALARALERPAVAQPRAGRPAPRPPAALRPQSLSVTEVQTLIRDPYAIYARHILRLRPLDPLGPDADAALRGEVLHGVMARFLRNRPGDEAPAAAAARLLALADDELAREVPWPAARRLWRAQFAAVAPYLLARLAAAPGTPAGIEIRGVLRIDPPGTMLTGRADRIDRLPDGRLHVIDYKTGSLPTLAEMEAFDKQLLIEAAMAERGGFDGLAPAPVARISHIGLRGEATERCTELAADATARLWEGLSRLLAAYGPGGRPYLSRRAVRSEGWAGDYDHLARFGEWEPTDPPAPETGP
ncbi:MAG: double-strand break repair protein AddB [Rhodobacteraceae bacterium]|nr:double-strand break repair protein AddB [Paracoccaceae bacterium]